MNNIGKQCQEVVEMDLVMEAVEEMEAIAEMEAVG